MFPSELKQLNQWLIWKWEKDKNNKWTKTPYKCNGQEYASSTDPETWSNIKEAYNAVQDGKADGLGLVVTENDPYCGIDLDHCRNPDTNEIDEWALELVNEFKSYTEITPSQTGIRIWIKASYGGKEFSHKRYLRDQENDQAAIEIYDRGRYFTATGEKLPDAPETIQDGQESLDRLVARLWPPKPAGASSAAPVASSGQLQARDIIDAFGRASNSFKFDRLMQGDESGYGSSSEADQALMSMIVPFYTENLDVALEVISASALWDKKWERKDYQKRTFEKAFEGDTGERYKAPSEKNGYKGTNLASLQTTSTPIPTLPKDFWESRESLRIIHQAAYSRKRPADAVLGCVLARISAGVPCHFKIPPIVGTKAPLNLIVGLVGPPGTGKGTSHGLACELVELDSDFVTGPLPLGSGEGIVESFFDLREYDANGKKNRQKVRAYWNATFYADEGEVLSTLGGRNGSTLLSTLRTAFSGGLLGQANATNERKRIIKDNDYSLSVIVGLQPELCGALLEDSAAGTPQRFLWMASIDPSVPDEQIDFPSNISKLRHGINTIARQSTPGSFSLLRIPDSIINEVTKAALNRVRGIEIQDSMQAHHDLLKLKVSACLGLLERQDQEITEEDWQLASIIKETSDKVREHTQRCVAEKAKEQEVQISDKIARREVHKTEEIEGWRVIEAAKRIRDKVNKYPDISPSELNQTHLRRWRDVFGEALDYAEKEQWIEIHEEAGRGTAKRMLRPGKRAS